MTSTPVESFARAHEEHRIVERRYRELIPVSFPQEGEQFAFDRLRIESCVRADGRLALSENMLLDPSRRPLPVTARMGTHTHLATFCALCAGASESLWRDLEESLNQVAAGNTHSGAIWGTSTLASDGVIARGLGGSGRNFRAALFELWRTAKSRVTGEEAVPPRKVY